MFSRKQKHLCFIIRITLNMRFESKLCIDDSRPICDNGGCEIATGPYIIYIGVYIILFIIQLLTCAPVWLHSLEWYLKYTDASLRTNGILWTVWNPLPPIFPDKCVSTICTVLRSLVSIILNLFMKEVMETIIKSKVPMIILNVHGNSDG